MNGTDARQQRWAIPPALAAMFAILIVAAVVGVFVRPTGPWSLRANAGTVDPSASASPSESMPPFGSPSPSMSPSLPPGPAPGDAVVTYEVTGLGHALIQYNDSDFNHLEIPDATLPWRMSFDREGIIMQVVAYRLSSDTGSIECRIYRAGLLMAVRSASGPRARVGCVLV